MSVSFQYQLPNRRMSALVSCCVLSACNDTVNSTGADAESEREAVAAVVRFIVQSNVTADFVFDSRLMPPVERPDVIVPPGITVHLTAPISPVMRWVAEQEPGMTLVDAAKWSGRGILVLLSRPVVNGGKATVQAAWAMDGGTVAYVHYKLDLRNAAWVVSSDETIGWDN